MPELQNLQSLIAVVTPLVGVRVVVGIEGHSTSGKTTLCRKLAHRCRGTPISTDAYIEKESRSTSYTGMVKRHNLLEDLTRFTLDGTAFIEGICLRDTVSALGVVPRAFIYCKRITPAGLWSDDPSNYVKDGVPRADLSWVDHQSVSYHLRESPIEKADFIYSWQET